MTDYLLPGLLLIPCLLALKQGQEPYGLLLEGAGRGLTVLKDILPPLVLLVTAVHLLQASGAANLLSRFLAPVFSFFGIPPECALLVLIRPVSGSAALAVGAELMRQYGVDSPIGRNAAVMLGSTETTFYIISVYFGAAGVSRTRYAIPAALTADFVGFCTAGLMTRLLFP